MVDPVLVLDGIQDGTERIVEGFKIVGIELDICIVWIILMCIILYCLCSMLYY